MELVDTLSVRFPEFLLVLTRVGGLLVTAPVFSTRLIPVQWKVAFSLLFALLLLPLLPALPEPPPTLWHWMSLAVQEAVFGLTAGFVTSLSLAAIQVAGQIVDVQIGFGMVNVLDPQLGTQVPLIGSFYQVLAMLIFLLSNGHHQLLRAAVASFHAVPLDRFTLAPDLQPYIVQLFSHAFVLGLKLALPVLATLLLTDVGIGLMSRAVPQMNLFVIGLPAKVLVGLIALLLAMPAVAGAVEQVLLQAIHDLGGMLRVLQP